MIEKRSRRDRDGRAYKVWRVRWRDDSGVERSRTLPRGSTKEDAEAFERRVMTLKRTGQLHDLDAGRETLGAFVEEWWEVYAAANLARSTLEVYAAVYNRHLDPRIGHLPLRELNPQVIARLRADLERAGVGAPTIRKALAMLQGVLARAVEWRRIPQNPVAHVRKPSATRDRPVRVVTIEQVECLGDELERHGGPRDATLGRLLAYSGARPGEALRLRWDDVGERTLSVPQPKTGRAHRPVRLVAPLRADLAAWRLAARRPAASAPVFPDGAGEHCSDADFRNWRRRIFKPAAQAAGLEGLRPYDLRHSFASLLIAEGTLSVVEIAAQMGHSPQMLLSTYAHVLAEVGGSAGSVEEQIRAVREERGRWAV